MVQVISRREEKEPLYPRCPICGRECDTIIRNRYGEITGCDNCQSNEDAWEAPECFPAGRFENL